MMNKIQDIITESITVKNRVLNDPDLIAKVGEIVTLIVQRFRERRHLLYLRIFMYHQTINLLK